MSIPERISWHVLLLFAVWYAIAMLIQVQRGNAISRMHLDATTDMVRLYEQDLEGRNHDGR